MSNYVAKADLKNATGVDTLNIDKKTDLTSLKSDFDKLYFDKIKNLPSNLSNLKSKLDRLDIGQIETTSVDLCKLSNVVKN